MSNTDIIIGLLVVIVCQLGWMIRQLDSLRWLARRAQFGEEAPYEPLSEKEQKESGELSLLALYETVKDDEKARRDFERQFGNAYRDAAAAFERRFGVPYSNVASADD